MTVTYREMAGRGGFNIPYGFAAYQGLEQMMEREKREELIMLRLMLHVTIYKHCEYF